jgi:hypothetical protein
MLALGGRRRPREDPITGSSGWKPRGSPWAGA